MKNSSRHGFGGRAARPSLHFKLNPALSEARAAATDEKSAVLFARLALSVGSSGAVVTSLDAASLAGHQDALLLSFFDPLCSGCDSYIRSSTSP